MKKILGVKRPLKMGVKRPGCETTGNPLSMRTRTINRTHRAVTLTF